MKSISRTSKAGGLYAHSFTNEKHGLPSKVGGLNARSFTNEKLI